MIQLIHIHTDEPLPKKVRRKLEDAGVLTLITAGDVEVNIYER